MDYKEELDYYGINFNNKIKGEKSFVQIDDNLDISSIKEESNI